MGSTYIRWIGLPILTTHNYQYLIAGSGAQVLLQWMHLATVNWSDEVNWWVPPVHLVSCMLQHAEVCKALGTVIYSTSLEISFILVTAMPRWLSSSTFLSPLYKAIPEIIMS